MKTTVDWKMVFEKLTALQQRYPMLGIRLLLRPDGSGHIYGLTDLSNHPLFDFTDLNALQNVLTELWDEALAAFDQRYKIKIQEGKNAKPK